MKKIVKMFLSRCVHDRDPLQFAYVSNRCVDDATGLLLHKLYSHADSVGNYSRVLFVDFSSVFNTIQPHLLVTKFAGSVIQPVLNLVDL